MSPVVQAVENITGDAVEVCDGATQPNPTRATSGSQRCGQPAIVVTPDGALEQLNAGLSLFPNENKLARPLHAAFNLIIYQG